MSAIPLIMVLSLALIFSERRWRSQKDVFKNIASRYSMKSTADQQSFRSCGYFRNRLVMCGVHRKKPRLFLGRFHIKIAILIDEDRGRGKPRTWPAAAAASSGAFTSHAMSALDPDWARILIEDGWVILERARFSLTDEELEELMTLACDISTAVLGRTATALSA